MVKYLVVHNKHEGCYDFQYYQDDAARIRLTSITINPPKIYMFNTRDEAQDFFEEYINDVDCIDIRCKRGDDVEHIEYCTCGVIELDEEENPILFYNRKNQIFLLEHGPQLFVPPSELKSDIKHLNLTNRLIRKCKSLSREQRNRYIELGRYCQDCNIGIPEEEDKTDPNPRPKSDIEKQLDAILNPHSVEKEVSNTVISNNTNSNTTNTKTNTNTNTNTNNDSVETETKQKPKTVRKKKTDEEKEKDKEKKPKAPRKNKKNEDKNNQDS